MPIYKVTQTQTTVAYNYVQADTAEEAIAIAHRPEAGDWAFERSVFGPTEATDATEETLAAFQAYRQAL